MKDDFIQIVLHKCNEMYELCMKVHFIQTVLNKFFKLFLQTMWESTEEQSRIEKCRPEERVEWSTLPDFLYIMYER